MNSKRELTKRHTTSHRFSSETLRRTLGVGLVLLGVLVGLYQIAPRHDRADSSLLPLATQDVAFHALSVRAVGSESASRFIGMPIEAIEVGQRVLAHNPDALQETELNGPEPNPGSWRVVRLVMSKHDGGRLEITLLRSLQWLEEHRAEVGADVLLDTAELNACGAAQVVSIEPCPEIAPGPGRVVIGTFRHDSSSIVDLRIEGLAEPIGTTSDHPFWSRDRASFVAAGELHSGEALLSAEGESLIVESVTPRPGTSPVHNLEIQGLHAYTVSNLGVVVHNNGAYGGGVPNNAARFDIYKSLRAEGLNASEAYAVMARRFTTYQRPDGTFVTSLGRSAHLEARLLDGGVLFIDSTSVAKSLRGQGISHELFEQTLSGVGANNVRSVQSYFGPGTNLDVARAGIDRGLTPAQAAILTPRGRTAIRFGFTNIGYDPFTGIFSASR